MHFGRRRGEKLKHKAAIGAMYVKVEAQGRGVGRALLLETLNRAKETPGLEEVLLAVTVGNDRARRLYTSVGFQPFCLEPRLIKVGAAYHDVEWLALCLFRCPAH